MMKWLRNVAHMLSARQWWTACGLLLLLALLWSVSLSLDWRMTIPLVGTVVLLAIAMASLLIDRFRAVRTAASLEQSIRGQAEDQRFSVRPERREQIEQIEQEFTEAVESLKRSKIGKGQRGRAALYALPWYVVVGPPAVGKTTAINESGLDFPLGANRVRGIGGTRNCDWFFSSDAILLDTAGRYVTVEEDRDEWLKFLDLLRLHRRRAPVNGVIVMVSIHELLQMSAEQLDDAATEMRQRINELIDRLGVRFPVYLVFTKCDLLCGFVEFFDTLDRKEREQVWGCTLGRHQHPGDPAEHFEREFDLLVQALVDRRLARLTATSTDPETAREVYLFPLEFAATRETLSQFVGRLLQPNPYQDNPDFRGFYFTSAVQKGAASDHVLRSITDSFELAAVRMDHAPAEPGNRSYFLGSLFSDVIIRDRNRVAPTSKLATTRERVRRMAIACVALLVGGFAWWSGSAFARSAREISAAAGAAEAGAGATTLADLDSLRRVIARLDHSAATTEQLLRLGLDRSPSLARDLRLEYVRRARPIFDAMFFQPIEARLRSRIARSARLDAERRADAKEDLRAYLLFGAEFARLVTEDSTVERPFLKGYLQRFDGVRQRDTTYTNLFADVMFEPVMRTDSQLVAQVRQRLYIVPTFDGLYDEMMHADGARRLPPITIAGAVGGASSMPFDRSGHVVRGVFTKAGWDGYVQTAIEQWSKEPGKTDWVIGSRPDRLTADLRDPERLAGMLLQRYFEEYVAEWRDFLRGARYRRLDMRGAGAALDALGDPERSALIKLIDTAAVETRFENPALTASKAKLKPFIDRVLKAVGLQHATGPAGESANPVDRTFAPLHALRAQGGAPLRQILAQYQTFGQMVQTLAGSDDALSQLSVEKGRASGAIGQATGKLDDEIREVLFEEPLDLVLEAVRRGKLDEIEGGWRDQVCRPYQTTLAGLYPFAANGKDASIKDVESFLRPRTGAIWEFYDKKLASLLKAGTFQPVGAQGAAISAAVASSLRSASAINNLFFDRDELRVDFDVTPELAQVDVVAGPRAFASEFCLRVDGQAYCSRMGYREGRPFTWPGRTSEVGAQVSATIQGADRRPLPLRALESPGPWGWLRLLEKADVTSERGETFATWLLEEPGRYKVRVKFKLTPKGGRNPFEDGNRRLFSRFVCPSNLRKAS